MTQAKTIPRQAAERFALTYANFVAGVRDALALAPHHQSAPRWQYKALPLLSRDLNNVETAMKSYEAGDQQPLLRCASSALSLSKNLDGFPLDFVSEESGSKLSEQLRFVVMAAWQVQSGAGIV